MFTITSRSDTEALLLEKFKPFSPNSIPLAIPLNTVTSSTIWTTFSSPRFGNSPTKPLKRNFKTVSTLPNKPPPNNARIVKKTEVRKTRTKTLTTSNNHIRIFRRHRRCDSCRQYSFPAEGLLGFDNDYTRGARRLIAFAAAKSSYALAAFQLKEFGCLTVSHQTVGNLVASLSDEVADKLANNAAVRKAFQASVSCCVG